MSSFYLALAVTTLVGSLLTFIVTAVWLWIDVMEYQSGAMQSGAMPSRVVWIPLGRSLLVFVVLTLSLWLSFTSFRYLAPARPPAPVSSTELPGH